MVWVVLWGARAAAELLGMHRILYISFFGLCFGERGPHNHWKFIEFFTFPSLGCALGSAGGPRMIRNALNSTHVHGFGSALGAPVAPESSQMDKIIFISMCFQ